MSDAGRKGVTDQISETVKPDSQKSTMEKASESVTSGADKVMGSVQPNDTKSTSQEASDTIRGGSNDAGSEGKSMLQSASDTISGALGGDKK